MVPKKCSRVATAVAWRAITVFSSRQAMVIGPTPPGTGVMAPATFARLGEGDVADQPARRASTG